MPVLIQNAFYNTISKPGLKFTLNDCKPPVPVWFITGVHQLQLYCVWLIINHACKNVPGPGGTLNVEVIGMLVGSFLENPKKYPDFDFKPLKKYPDCNF